MDEDFLRNRLVGSDDEFQGNLILDSDDDNNRFLPPLSDDENERANNILGDILEQEENTVDVQKYRKLYDDGHINFAEFNRLKRKKSGRKKTGPKSWTKYVDNPQNRAINRVGYTKRAACDWPLLEPPQNEDTDNDGE